jgi:uncharacterized membrane protein
MANAIHSKINIITMKKLTPTDGAALLIWLLPVAYLVWIYSSLPAIVPMHYDRNGVPNGFGSRGGFVVMQLFLQAVSAGVYLLMRFLPSIDPKKQAKYSEATLGKLALGITLFMAAISIGIIYATVHKGFRIDKLLFPLMGLLVAFLGNMMNNIKPNYFVGIRTPWTLEDPDTWKATHRLAAKIWFIGGLLITLITLIAPGNSVSTLFPATVAVIVLIPVAYSYIYYKNHRPA